MRMQIFSKIIKIFPRLWRQYFYLCEHTYRMSVTQLYVWACSGSKLFAKALVCNELNEEYEPLKRQ